MTVALIFGTAGGNKTATGLFVGTAGGNKTVQTGYVGTAGGNKVFYSTGGPDPLVALASPDAQYWAPDGGDFIGSVTVSASGGTPGYTYLWSVVSGSATFSAATSTATDVMSATDDGVTVKCTVTDAAMAAVDSNPVSLAAEPPPLDATASPGSQTWTFVPFDGHYEGGVSVSASGGTAPYFYAWEAVSGSVTFSDVSSDATFVFSATSGAASVKCVVTDALMANVDSNTVGLNP